ncbi:LacI family DNA-binding transcriptional regulator [Gracilibacillus salinarum]|uniref:LacI family transcriptional regulator n=1 Tax=Gracilibacillus salinarum TaxID=2932255 RepID=A0ABY4GRW0_9BACI|nr:LacI family DNA-binding transcriptional regulator [Gracilibacillus salinarum]UOQ86961.1 LacI family transcriptional regulator [Gracilibacillus salinarum]
MKVTIADVAEKAGVSKTTVSRILNGNHDHNTPETIQTVLRVVEELEYRPNALAKGLKSMKTNVIGIVLSNFRNEFWFNVLEGVEDTCKDQGYNLMICNSDGDPKLEEQYIREFQMRQVDGIVINPTVRNQRLYEKLMEDKYPMVVINRKIPGLHANNVVVDNIKGGYLAVDHLLDNGRKHILAITYKNENISTWQERIKGYQDALISHGLTESSIYILEITSLKKAPKQIKKYLEENPMIDAVFSTNNMLTLELIEALKKMNKNVPADIGIVSYDDTIWAKHINPPLTTIKQPSYDIGKEAAKLLINEIRSKEVPTIKNIIFQPELVVRESSEEIE